jgi:IS605 OrfB family transposase
VAAGDGLALLVSARAIRTEHRQHLADTKARRRATAARAPTRGQRGSRRWRKTRRRARLIEGRHRRRVRQAGHEAAKTVIDWAVQHRVGTLTVGDPRGVLELPAGRRHNLRLRQWQLGRAIAMLKDKTELAGVIVQLVDERGTSSTCPVCRLRVVKPSGRTMICRNCGSSGIVMLPRRSPSPPGPQAAPPPPHPARVGWSRTVEQDRIFPVSDCPGVTHAVAHQRRRSRGPLAG